MKYMMLIDGEETAAERLGGALDGYHLFHATRAVLLRRAGRQFEADEADRRALGLTGNPAERRLIEERLSPRWRGGDARPARRTAPPAG